MTDDRQFAFGGDCVHGVECPATAAGYPTNETVEQNPWFARVAEQYDVYVRMKLYERGGGDYADLPDNPDAVLKDLRPDLVRGVIEEPLARECWSMAMDAQGAPEGRLVAEELGWA